jgi:hypothetical protein
MLACTLPNFTTYTGIVFFSMFSFLQNTGRKADPIKSLKISNLAQALSR